MLTAWSETRLESGPSTHLSSCSLFSEVSARWMERKALRTLLRLTDGVWGAQRRASSLQELNIVQETQES